MLIAVMKEVNKRRKDQRVKGLTGIQTYVNRTKRGLGIRKNKIKVWYLNTIPCQGFEFFGNMPDPCGAERGILWWLVLDETISSFRCRNQLEIFSPFLEQSINSRQMVSSACFEPILTMNTTIWLSEDFFIGIKSEM